MNPTDTDFSDLLGRELKGASARHNPPSGLYPRVAARQRQLQQRRASSRAGAVGLAAVATVGGIAWAQSTRNPAATAQPADGAAAALTPSAHPDRIDFYPIIDSVPGVGASYGWTDTDQGWSGTVGFAYSGEVPTSIMGISSFPNGWPEAQFPSTSGRVPGVHEEAVANGMTRLVWKSGDIPMSVVGGDLDLMYQLVDIVQPTTTTATRGGYTFTRALPEGLVELEAPYHRLPLFEPMVDTNDSPATFSAMVVGGPLLTWLAGAGMPYPEPITINGRPGYRSTTGDPTIALALSTDETLFIHSSTYTMDQLIAAATDITITDEATWKAHYGVTDEPTGPTTTLPPR
jgi:hypothetical protein